MQYKTGLYFFHLILVGIEFSLILSVKNRVWGEVLQITKIYYAWQKLFVNDYLVAGCFHLNSTIT